MALPTPTDLATMNYAFRGQPFVEVPAKSAVALAGMGYAYQGQPFVRNEGAGGAPPAPSDTGAFFLMF